VLVQVDPRYFRPAEVDVLIGDPSKAREKLGWNPRVQLGELIEMMVDEDLRHAEKELHLKSGGFAVKDYNE
jgi:GDPmannose 4,6-dehydratase